MRSAVAMWRHERLPVRGQSGPPCSRSTSIFPSRTIGLRMANPVDAAVEDAARASSSSGDVCSFGPAPIVLSAGPVTGEPCRETCAVLARPQSPGE